MFIDKTGDEQVDKVKEKMRHALVAGDLLTLKAAIIEAEVLP